MAITHFNLLTRGVYAYARTNSRERKFGASALIDAEIGKVESAPKEPYRFADANQGADTAVRIDQDSEQDIQRLADNYGRESMAANAEVMEELADGTGGTFYHNSNDLEAGFGTLVSVPDYTYLLAFSTANTKQHVHHSLKVKVNKPGLTVQARRGYSTPAPEKHKK